MEQEARVRVFLSPLWKELIRVSEFPFAISAAGCQLIAHLLWERPAGKRRTAGPSYLPPSQALLSVSQVQQPPPRPGLSRFPTRCRAGGHREVGCGRRLPRTRGFSGTAGLPLHRRRAKSSW